MKAKFVTTGSFSKQILLITHLYERLPWFTRKSKEFNDFAIVIIRNYKAFLCFMTKNEAVNRMANADMCEKIWYKIWLWKNLFLVVPNNEPEAMKQLEYNVKKKAEKSTWKKVDDSMKKTKRGYKKWLTINTRHYMCKRKKKKKKKKIKKRVYKKTKKKTTT